MVEELETSTPRAPRLTLHEVADIVATWAVVGAVLGVCWAMDKVHGLMRAR